MHMALETRPWTRADLDRLPDDGNRYEVLDGELLVTPPPSVSHQEIVAWLSAKLTPFVTANGLGTVHHPRSVMVDGGSQVEPDLMVRPLIPHRGWDDAPVPILVVEVLSRSTRRRDLHTKRAFYIESGVGEYWVVDRENRSVTRIAADRDEPIRAQLIWSPKGSTDVLTIDVALMFAEVEQSAL